MPFGRSRDRIRAQGRCGLALVRCVSVHMACPGRYPDNTPRTKEAYWYRTLFESHFPQASHGPWRAPQPAGSLERWDAVAGVPRSREGGSA